MADPTQPAEEILPSQESSISDLGDKLSGRLSSIPDGQPGPTIDYENEFECFEDPFSGERPKRELWDKALIDQANNTWKFFRRSHRLDD